MSTRVSSDALPSQAAIWSLAWPSITVFLITTLTSLTVIKIVSGLGTSALAAAVAGQRIYFIYQAVLMGLGAGTTAMVAREWGAGAKDEAIAYMRLAIAIGLTVSIFIALYLIFAAPIIARFFELTGDSYNQAIIYIRWLNLFNPGFALFLLISSALRAVGDAKRPLYISCFANVLVILFATVLTHGYQSIPALGVKGAAIGAGAGYTLGAIIITFIWWREKLSIGFRLNPITRKPRLQSLLTVSYPAIAEQCVMQGALLVFLWLVAQYGTEAFAAYGVGLNLLTVTIVIGFGFSIAGSALVGQYIGAGDHKGAIACGYQTMRLTMFYMTLCGAMVICFSTPLARLIVDDPEVVRLSAVFITFLGLAQPLLAIDFALGGALRGAGDTRFPLFSTFCGFVGVRLTLAYIFTKAGLSVEWIFGALLGDYLVKSGLLLWHYRSERWLKTTLVMEQHKPQ